MCLCVFKLIENERTKLANERAKRAKMGLVDQDRERMKRKLLLLMYTTLSAKQSVPQPF